MKLSSALGKSFSVQLFTVKRVFPSLEIFLLGDIFDCNRCAVRSRSCVLFSCYWNFLLSVSAIIESKDLHSDIYALFKYFPTVFDDDRKPQNRRYYSTLLELVKLLEGKHICKFS